MAFLRVVNFCTCLETDTLKDLNGVAKTLVVASLWLLGLKWTSCEKVNGCYLFLLEIAKRVQLNLHCRIGEAVIEQDGSIEYLLTTEQDGESVLGDI